MSLEHVVEVKGGPGALRVGEMVVVMTRRVEEQTAHWTLGSVESAPYLYDVEIRLWEKQIDVDWQEQFNVGESQEEGELIMQIKRTKEELEGSIQHVTELTKKLRERRKSILREIDDVENHASQSRAAVKAAYIDVKGISYHHWHELKSYRAPSRMVLTILRAVMLLLSEDDAKTWPQMQRVLRDPHFKSRILDYDPDKELSRERGDYILYECVRKKSFRYDRAVQGSQAMGPIYYWVLAQLDRSEATGKQHQLEKRKQESQKELRSVINEIHKQQQRMAEYQALMDSADDQLHVYRALQRESASLRGGQLAETRLREVAQQRYETSFAGAAGKEYLRAAFYTWKPTEYRIMVLRKSVLVNFGTVPQDAWDKNNYTLDEPQIRMLDEALQQSQSVEESFYEKESEQQQQQHKKKEEEEIEEGLFHPVDGTYVPKSKMSVDWLERTFEGEDWKYIMDRKRLAIMDTFCDETAEALQLPRSDISITQMTCDESNNLLMVSSEVRHDGSRSRGDLMDAMNAYLYPKLSALYSNELDGFAKLEKRFDGKDWQCILTNHKNDVEYAFKNDTATALGKTMEDTEIQNITATEEALVIKYLLNIKKNQAKRAKKAISDYKYPEICQLYSRLKPTTSTEDKTYSTKRIELEGEDWDYVLERRRAEVKDVLAVETARALGLEREDVLEVEVDAVPRSLIAFVTVRHPSLLSDRQVEETLARCEYKSLWALYETRPLESSVLVRRFEGDDWDLVVDSNRRKLEDAFSRETAAALGVSPSQVVLLDCRVGSLLMVFKVLGCAMSDAEITERTEAHPYDEVYALYRPRLRSFEGVDAAVPRGFRADADEVWTRSRVEFEGEDWDYVLAMREADLLRAFSNATAEAFGVDGDHVRDVSARYVTGNLHFDFELRRPAALTEADVNARLKECAYAAVWALYEPRPLEEEKKAVTTHELGFEGEDWDYVLERRRAEVKDVLAVETARALGLEREDVLEVEVDAVPRSLIAFVTVRHPSLLSDRQVEETLARCEYKSLWALYETRPLESSVLVRRFEGDDWDLVVDSNRRKLEDAFSRETAAALGVSPSQVVLLDCRVGSLLMVFKVLGCAMSDAEITERTETHPYDEVYALYRPRLRSFEGVDAAVPRGFRADADEVWTRSRVEFEGEDWDYVLAMREADLLRAFSNATAEAFGVDGDHVRDVSARYVTGNLHFDFELRRPAALTEADVNARLKECAYAAVWALYEPRPLEEEKKAVTTHELGFEGEDWDYVLERRRAEVKDVLAVETARALGLEREDVLEVEVDAVPRSLIAFVTVRHPSLLSDRQVEETLARCEYKSLWALYETRPLESSVLMRRFEGDDWDLVVDSNRRKLEDAFSRETAAALGVSPSQVVLLDCRVGSLLMVFKVLGCAMSDAEITERTETHPYDEVYALYRPRLRSFEGVDAAVPRGFRADADEVWTRSRVEFEGEDWDYVLAMREADLLRAFSNATAEAFGVDGDHVRDVSARYVTGNLHFDFELRRPAALTEADVNARLKECAYAAVWALYEPRPLEEEKKAVTTHELGFEGEDWDYVLERRRAEVKDVLAVETARALGLEREDVLEVEVDAVPRSLIAFVTVRHPSLLSDRQVEETLARCEYKSLWALYEARPLESSVLMRRFEGDDWDLVVDSNRRKLEDAFSRETAAALGVSPSQVVLLDCRVGSLLMVFKVLGCAMSDAEITERTETHPYDEVYALYRPRLRSFEGVDAAVPRGFRADADEVWTRSRVEFEGEDWDYVLAMREADLLRAFSNATAEAFGVDGDHVRDVSARYVTGNLHFDFELRRPAALTEADVNARLKECAYAAVWALYEPRPLEEEKKAVTTHELGFEGEDWDYVLERRRAEVKDVLAVETARALGLEREDVLEVEVDAVPRSLIAFVTVRHPSLLSDRQVEETLARCEYKSLWALYEARPLESSVLMRRFEGDDWDLVVDSNRRKLEDAFSRETAAALGVSPSQVVLLDCRVGSLLMVFKVLGCAMSDAEITERTEAHPYDEVYALYRPRLRSFEGVDAAVPRGFRADADEVWTRSRVEFEGEDWDYVLAMREADLLRAFSNATAEAFGVDGDHVRDVSARYVTGNLHFDFELRRPAALTEADVNARLKECAYAAVWALYEPRPLEEEKKAVTTHELGFEGEDWDYVLERRRAEVKDVLAVETARALGLEREDVLEVEVDAVPRSLMAFVTVRHPSLLSDRQVEETLARCEYKSLWALYEARPLESSVLMRRFEGDDWDLVVDSNRRKLEDAFSRETAAALGVSPSQVVLLDCRVGSLLMVFKVLGCAMSDAEITERTETHPYDEVYALYRPRLRSFEGVDAAVPRGFRADADEVWTRSRVEFEGEDWDYVLAMREADLLRAFSNATAEAFGVDGDHVRDVSARYVTGNLHFDFELRRPAALTEADVNARLKECAYAAVWALYEPRPLEEEKKAVTTHELGFEGEDWDYVLERRRAEVKDVLAVETARALGLEREDVLEVEVDAVPRSLIAFVTVRHPSLLSDRQVEETLARCEYKSLWALYEARPLESSVLMRRFEGDDWDLVVDSNRRKLEDAFSRETAAALGVSPSQVVLLDCRVGSLLMVFKVLGCAMSDAEITERTEAHPYDEVYALYRPRLRSFEGVDAAVPRGFRADADEVWTRSRVEFEGEDWDYVLAMREADLLRAFSNATAEAFGVDGDHVRDVSARYVTGNLHFDFELRRPAALTEADVNARLKECAYAAVWALYEPRPLEEEKKAVTTHELGFEGEDWDYVLERRRAEVKDVLAVETARALGLEREDVLEVEVDAVPRSLMAFVTVRHPSLLSDRQVEETLARCEYKSLWALYETRPLESSVLMRRFEGDDWDLVVDSNRRKLEDAFSRETAAALGVSPSQVVLLDCRVGSLLMVFKVLGCAMSDAEITERTETHPYDEVYALYRPRLRSFEGVDAAVPRGFRADADEVWTRSRVEFEGEDWDYVLAMREADLLRAFSNATAEAFGVDGDHVRDVSARYVTGNLHFDFELRRPAALTKADVNARLKECAYAAVWALYEPRPLEEEKKAVTTHELGFEGEDWDYVLERRRAEVKDVLAVETARALGLEREDVLEVEVDAVPRSLIAFVTVRHPSLLSDRQVEETLARCEYKSLWALYETRPLESSVLMRRFEGDDWDLVVDSNRRKLEDAFSRETAAALGVSPSQVVLLDCRVGSLLMVFKVLGCAMSDAEITERTETHPYDEVYALYRPRLRSFEGVDAAVPRGFRADADEVWTRSRVEFEGEDWDYVLAMREADLLRAFSNATAEAFGVDGDHVRDVSARYVTGNLHFDFELRRPAALTEADVNARLKECAYAAVWALYEPRPLEEEKKAVTTHELGFEGEDWDYVLERRRAEVKDVLAVETARALGLEREDVLEVEVDAVPRSLIAFVTVRHPSLLSDRRVEETLARCEYKSLWALYETRPLESSVLMRRFEGDDWDLVVDSNRRKLEDAFSRETAAALGVSPSQVVLLDCRVGSLLMVFKVLGCAMSDAEITERTEAHPYDEVYALYRPRLRSFEGVDAAVPRGFRADADEVWTRSRVEFEGEDWDYVLAMREADLLRAFSNATAEAFGVDGDHVRDVSARYVTGNLHFDFELRRPAALTKADVNARLKECAYAAVWALYEPRPLEEEKKAVTTHELGFEGEDWDYVLERRRAEVKDVLAVETARALGLEREDVLEVEVDAVPRSLIAFVTVRHPSLLSDRRVEETLARCEYKSLWALYETRPLESSVLMRRFEGDDWDLVVDSNRRKLEDAFSRETAAALGVSPSQVVLLDCRVGSLLMVFKVLGCAMSDAEITERTETHPYDEVYALYRPRLRSFEGVDAAVPRGFRADADEVWTRSRVEFEGEDWDYVLAMREADLLRAFSNATAEAFGVDGDHVRDVSARYVTGNLHFDFELRRPAALTKADVNARLKECAYAAVWALYEPRPLEEEKKAVTTHELGFEGEDWDYVLERRRAEVKDVLAVETARALGLEREDVLEVEVDAVPRSLMAFVTVRHPSLLSDRRVEETLARCEYKSLWALYETRPLESSVLMRRFEGDDWDLVVDSNRRKLEDAFSRETAAALGVSPSQVVLLDCRVGSLLMVFKVLGCAMSDAEITERTETHPYDEVYALYRPRLRSFEGVDAAVPRGFRADADEVWTRSRVEFEGEDWDYVLAMREADLLRAFSNATAEAFGVDGDHVRDVSARYVTGNLHFDFELRRPAALTKADVNARLKECAYAAVWALYEPRPLEEEKKAVTTHELGFEGEDWDYVLERRRAEVKDVLAVETARALGLEREDVLEVEVDAVPRSLIAFVTVRHPSLLSDRRVEETLARCEYKSLWALYETRPLESSVLMRRFEGDDWDLVVDSNRRKLEDAFSRETAAALGVSPSQVVLLDCRVGSLLMVFKVLGCAMSDAEITERTETHPYDEVYALYRPRLRSFEGVDAAVPRGFRADADEVWTRSRVEFEGEDWDYVLAMREADLLRAFSNATAEAFGVDGDHVRDVSARYVTGNLHFDFELRRPAALTKADVNARLKECAYAAVWALYEPRPLEEEKKAVTTHELGFEGEDWDYVLERRRAEVKDVLAVETARALGLEREDVLEVEVDAVPRSLIAFVTVRHPSLLSDRRVEETLARCEYKSLWALYETRPLESSVLMRRFEGDDWDLLVDSNRRKLEDAFSRETAAALGVSPSQVVLLDCRVGSLLMVFKVLGCAMSDAEITERTEAHPYDEVYALYRPRLRSFEGVDAAVPRGFRADADEVWTRSRVEFEGEDWDYVLAMREADLLRAFSNATAEAFGVDGDHVRDVSARYVTGNLHFDFELRRPAALTKADVNARLKECAYAAVWALYEPRPLEEEKKAVTTHELGFEGEDWDYVLERRRAEVKDVLAVETARALGLEREDVLEVEVDAVPRSLIAFVTVRHPSLLSDRQVEETLARCEYKSLWALYETRPLESSGAVRPRLIVAEEVEEELDSITFLRNALRRARRERDEYLALLDPLLGLRGERQRILDLLDAD